ncbi:MAG: cupin domain-containing protein [Candidatus Micrarchaeota archaeon]|nr:cupin domain-containing protein [Candidatus Micrarchaeota archaeon]
METRKIERKGKLIDSESLHFKSGCVELAPGQSIGEHSTKSGEEIIVILEGKAKVVCNGEESTAEARSLVLIPPNSKHNVTNIGDSVLKYVYIVSKNGVQGK